jgi:hypothetical protein
MNISFSALTEDPQFWWAEESYIIHYFLLAFQRICVQSSSFRCCCWKLDIILMLGIFYEICCFPFQKTSTPFACKLRTCLGSLWSFTVLSTLWHLVTEKTHTLQLWEVFLWSFFLFVFLYKLSFYTRQGMGWPPGYMG